MKEFKDKVAVITGAASGIGRGIANRAVKEGMKIVLADIEKETLSRTEQELKKSGANVLSVVTDVSKLEDMENLAKITIDVYGKVHLLCNNAGVGIPGFLWEYTLSDWKWVINVNLWGVIHGIRTFIPIMTKQNDDCHIVNTSSLAGLVSGGLDSGIYSVTKHGVVVLSEALNRELELIKSRIKVSVLCPGYVRTRILDCERNRQLDYCDADYKPSYAKFIKNHPEYEISAKAAIQNLEKGMSPDKVGEIVFQAIKNDIFYILTDSHYIFKKAVKNRLEGIINAFEQNKQIHKSLEKSS